MAKLSSFGAAFKAARKKLGAGKTFDWNGKSYSTNFKEEGAGHSHSPTSSPKPKPRPRADNGAALLSGLARGAAEQLAGAGAARRKQPGRGKPATAPPAVKPKPRLTAAAEVEQIMSEATAKRRAARKRQLRGQGR